MRKKFGSILLAVSIIAASGCSADTSSIRPGNRSAVAGESASKGSGDAKFSGEDSGKDKIEIPSTSTVIQFTGSKKTKQDSPDTSKKTDAAPSDGDLTNGQEAQPVTEPAEDLPQVDPPAEDPAEDTSAEHLPGEGFGQEDPSPEQSPDDAPQKEELPVSGSGEEKEVPAGEEGTQSEGELIRSNLPPEFKAELDKDHNGMLLLYHPENHEEIKSITKWTVVEYDTGTQLLLVTKAKGSIVEVTRAQITDDQQAIPGDVIRSWETTSDYEVIRILYTDPETVPLNFVRVRQPDGKVTVTALRTSTEVNSGWLAVQYDRHD